MEAGTSVVTGPSSIRLTISALLVPLATSTIRRACIMFFIPKVASRCVGNFRLARLPIFSFDAQLVHRDCHALGFPTGELATESTEEVQFCERQRGCMVLNLTPLPGQGQDRSAALFPYWEGEC